jgi:antitoxin component YwqK of YwqJK toxin-antitoxin module
MRIIRTLLFLTFFIYLQNTFAQRLTLGELHTFASNKNWESTNKNLISQGWEYYQSTESDSIGYNQITWSFKRNDYSEKANGWFYVYNIEGLPNKIMYRFRKKEYYTLLIKNLVPAGYKQTNEEIMNDRVIAYYENPLYYLQISYNKEEESDDDYSYYTNNKIYTVYEVSLYKKGGFYDPNNGLKTDYDENGSKSSSYTLKNGEMEGLYTSYDSIGRVRETVTYKKGIKEGISKIILYPDEGGNHLELKGTYKNDEQEGNWIGEVITPTEKRKVFDQNFINGKKEGLQKRIIRSEIIYENFKNDELNGKVLVYQSLKHMLVGGFAEMDTITNTTYKIKELNYQNNKLNGKAKYFDDFGSLISEGVYKDSLKTGIWKHYFPKIVDKNDVPVHYSEKLFLESNYLEGKLNGQEKRYAYIQMVKIPCDDTTEQKKDGFCYKDECFYISETCNYKDDELEGDYVLKKVNGDLVEKGSYSDGNKSGTWTEYNTSEICFWLEENTFETGLYVNDKKEYKWRRLDKNNTVLESYTYSNNKLEGEHIKYVDNKVVEKKYFKTGELFKQEFLDDNANVIKTYTIQNKNYNSLDCLYEYNNAKFKIKETYKYLVDVDFNINPIIFVSDFDKASNSRKILNGLYVKKTLDDKIIEFGNFSKGVKSGKWDYFDYEQNIKLSLDYSSDDVVKSEYYYDLKDNEPFSGEFEYKNEGEFEERKVKNGIRNGTTRYKDAQGKTIKKESYKEGVIKE